jgi:MFS family permease
MKFGGVFMFGIGILLGSIVTIFIPLAARTSLFWLVALRFLTGVFHGTVYPSLGTIWSNWAPKMEKSRLVGISNTGLQIGNIISMPIVGFLCVEGFDGGWPSVFYIFGI